MKRITYIISLIMLGLGLIIAGCAGKPKIEQSLLENFSNPQSQSLLHLESWKSTSDGLILNFQFNQRIPKAAVDFTMTDISTQGEVPKLFAAEIVKNNPELVKSLIESGYPLTVKVYETNPKESVSFTVSTDHLQSLLEEEMKEAKEGEEASDSTLNRENERTQLRSEPSLPSVSVLPSKE